ncbi:MAG: protein kinase [Candidatus Zophobacter franzmannii]|nr:protein kinase [Candidatus Zophobacter franzmannii]
MSLYQSNYEVKDYKIIRFCSSDSLGELYIAKDIILDRKVFLKVLTATHITNDLSVGLMEESTKQVALHHDTILTLNSIVLFDNRISLISDYSDGSTLDEILIKYNNFSEKKALTTLKDICGVLHEAHKFGLIHGSLSPKDIIIDDHGKVKIMNFTWRENLIPSMTNQELTEFYQYRAPELFIDNNQPTIKSDIYSVGLIMHLLINGNLPYKSGSNLVELYENLKNINITSQADLPEEIRSMQLKMLTFDPKDRFNQPFNLITHLNNFLFMREELFDFQRHTDGIDLPKKPVVVETPETLPIPEPVFEKEIEEEPIVTTEPLETLDIEDEELIETEEITVSEDEYIEVEAIEADPVLEESVDETKPVVENESEEVHVESVEDAIEDKESIDEALPAETNTDTASLKESYFELLHGYKRLITIAGLVFVVMVLIIFLLPDTLGAWLLGRY